VIFLDTSVIYALADQSDPFHPTARRRFEALLEAGEEILTHNYVLVEAMALIQSRLGLAAALRLARDSHAFDVEWVAEVTHQEAVRRLARRARRQVSLVYQVSFLIMRRRGIGVALAFDPDFEREGFHLYQEPGREPGRGAP
jgi:predicted nucleic acid-binding protein